jgi:hypothetical protein
MELKTYPDHLKAQFDREVGELHLALAESSKRAPLERLEVRQDGLSLDLKWKGEGKPIAHLVLEPTSVGIITVRLRSALQSNEESLSVKLEPYPAADGIRYGWYVPSSRVLTQWEFADFCVSRLLNRAAKELEKGS